MMFMGCARHGLLGATRRSGAYDPMLLIAAPTYLVHPLQSMYSSDVIQALLTESTWAQAAHPQPLSDSSDSRGVLCEWQCPSEAKKDEGWPSYGESEGSECAVR
jgi:hypothetical protein